VVVSHSTWGSHAVPLLRAYTPRHAKPSKAAPVLAAGGMTASFGAAAVATADGAAAATPVARDARGTAEDFYRLRVCESGNNYKINTGNGYYGAYQFDRRTWQGLGYSGTANQHPPATQDQAAIRLQAQRGWQPWPACSRKLGLGQSDDRASRSTRRVALRAGDAPTFQGTVLTKALVSQKRADVSAWQARMKARGWDIAVDGHFGPQSARVAARFAAEKGLKVKPGTVNRRVWNAAWALPVS
jgi:hypothetical protein